MAVIEGAIRGAGSEFALTLDMRFAAIGQWRLASSPAAVGRIFLARSTGRGRALDSVLGREPFDAERAKRYSWVNRGCRPMIFDRP